MQRSRQVAFGGVCLVWVNIYYGACERTRGVDRFFIFTDVGYCRFHPSGGIYIELLPRAWAVGRVPQTIHYHQWHWQCNDTKTERSIHILKFPSAWLGCIRVRSGMMHEKKSKLQRISPGIGMSVPCVAMCAKKDGENPSDYESVSRLPGFRTLRFARVSACWQQKLMRHVFGPGE